YNCERVGGEGSAYYSVEGDEVGGVGYVDPGGAAAGQPRLTLPGGQGLLGVLSLVVGAGDGVETPDPLAGLGVVGIDEAADAVLRTADAHDDLVLDHQRGDRGAVGHFVDLLALLAIRAGDGDLFVPDFLTGVPVEAKQVSVERGHVEAVAPGGKAAVDGVAAQGQALWQRFLVVPQ